MRGQGKSESGRKVASVGHVSDACPSLLHQEQATGKSGLFAQSLQPVTWKISAGQDLRAGQPQLTTRVPVWVVGVVQNLAGQEGLPHSVIPITGSDMPENRPKKGGAMCELSRPHPPWCSHLSQPGALQAQLLTPGYFEIQNFALCDTFWFQCLSPTSVCAPKPGPCRKGQPSRCGWVTPYNCYQVGMVWLLQRTGGDVGAAGCRP